MDQNFIKEKLNALREAKGLSFSALHTALKINRYTLKKLFDGDVESTRDKAMLRAVIEYFGQTEDQFFNRAVPEAERAPVVAAAPLKIPLYGEIPAGNPTQVEGRAQPDEWIDAPPGIRNPKVFALRVKGRSMYPRFMPGDIVFFEPLNIRMGVKDPQNPVPRLAFERLNGRVVAALVDNEATLKQLTVIGHADRDYELELKPLNQAYQPLRILPEHSVIFQGVAIKTIRDENGEAF